MRYSNTPANNNSPGNRFNLRLQTPSALRYWLEDLLSITLIVVVISSLVIAATLYLHNLKPAQKAPQINANSTGTIPAIYQRQESGHSIDI